MRDIFRYGSTGLDEPGKETLMILAGGAMRFYGLS